MTSLHTRLFAILIPTLFLGCANLRSASPPEYAFGRSLLNIQVAEPVRAAVARSTSNRGEDRPTVRTRPRHVARAKSPRASESKKSTQLNHDRRDRNRRTLRTISNKALSSKKDRSANATSDPDWEQEQTKTCSDDKCQARGFLSSARRLYGLRMRKEHDFIRHLLRVNDISFKVSSPAQIPKKLYQRLRDKDRIISGADVQAGDLVFFQETKGEAPSGQATLVGVVERVNERGTTFFLAQVSEVVDRSVVTAKKPGVRRDERTGEVLNSFVRTKSSRDPTGTQYLSGQLLLGFGRLDTQ